MCSFWLDPKRSRLDHARLTLRSGATRIKAIGSTHGTMADRDLPDRWNSSVFAPSAARPGGAPAQAGLTAGPSALQCHQVTAEWHGVMRIRGRFGETSLPGVPAARVLRRVSRPRQPAFAACSDGACPVVVRQKRRNVRPKGGRTRVGSGAPSDSSGRTDGGKSGA
jgi:hypothetical protein